jgi:hypothetical protein
LLPPAGVPALCHDERFVYQPFLLVPNPDGVVVCTANDYTKVLIAAGRARQHHKQCKGYYKERDHRSGSDIFFKYLGGFHPLPELRFAVRFKASAVAM